MSRMDSRAEGAYSRVLRGLGLRASDWHSRVTIDGEEPEELSPHWLATAAAVALAVQGTTVAAIWERRSGRGQNVSISMRDAAQSLSSFTHVAQNGVMQDFSKINMALTGYSRTADDRWIMFPAHHQYPHHLDSVLEVLDCAHTPEACAAAIGRWRGEDLEDALAERDAPCAMARTPEEWLEHPQGKWMASRPVIEIERIGDGPRQALGAAARPFSGIRVLDMTHVVGGPMLSRSLAEQGADVLHIGDPRQPDSQWMMLDTFQGKRSAFLKLTHSADQQRLKELAGECDIFVQSWRPGALDKFGVTPAELAVQRPGIIFVSLSCYGSAGPWAGRGGYDPNAQAVSGIAIAEGGDGPPRAPVTSTLNDYLVAYFGSSGVGAAMLRREREGGSYHVKVNLTRCSMWAQSFGLRPGIWRGPPESPVLARIGARHVTTRSVFGEIRNLAPPIQYSDTPAYWERPLEPFGACRPEWLPA